MISRVVVSRFVAVLAIGMVLAGINACSEDPVPPTPETAIRGTITEVGTSAALESVEVWISPPGTRMVYTNASGDYAIAGLTAGSYELHVMKAFYEIEDRTVEVKKEQTAKADFAIEEIVNRDVFDFWGKFRWHHYYASKGTWQWTQARLLSLDQGGHMVTIADASEDSLVREIAVATAPQTVAIGLTDEAQEGIWVWVTGEPFTYIHWMSGEPNNSGGNEDYGMLFVSTAAWNDYAGTGLMPFVLEIE